MATPSSQPSGTPLDTASAPLSSMQDALLQLREGLLTLRGSLVELAARHADELAMQQALPETDALMERLRGRG